MSAPKQTASDREKSKAPRSKPAEPKTVSHEHRTRRGRSSPDLPSPGALSLNALSLAQALAMPRIAIESIAPIIEGGRFAAKATEGEAITVSAVIFADGHDKLAARVLWHELPSCQPSPEETVTAIMQPIEWHEVPMQALGNDHWSAQFTPSRPGRYLFAIEAWWDQY